MQIQAISHFSQRTKQTARKVVQSIGILLMTSKTTRKALLFRWPRLGPLLFSLYVNDLPYVSSFETTLFADDTNLHISHNNIKILQSMVTNEI